MDIQKKDIKKLKNWLPILLNCQMYNVAEEFLAEDVDMQESGCPLTYLAKLGLLEKCKFDKKGRRRYYKVIDHNFLENTIQRVVNLVGLNLKTYVDDLFNENINGESPIGMRYEGNNKFELTNIKWDDIALAYTSTDVITKQCPVIFTSKELVQEAMMTILYKLSEATNRDGFVHTYNRFENKVIKEKI